MDEAIAAEATAPDGIADELSPDAVAESEQPTFVLPEQSTVVLETPTLKRRAIRAAKRAPAPQATNTPRSRVATLDNALRLPTRAERYIAARPWLWVVALLIVVCILALVSRQFGG